MLFDFTVFGRGSGSEQPIAHRVRIPRDSLGAPGDRSERAARLDARG